MVVKGCLPSLEKWVGLFECIIFEVTLGTLVGAAVISKATGKDFKIQNLDSAQVAWLLSIGCSLSSESRVTEPSVKRN